MVKTLMNLVSVLLLIFALLVKGDSGVSIFSSSPSSCTWTYFRYPRRSFIDPLNPSEPPSTPNVFVSSYANPYLSFDNQVYQWFWGPYLAFTTNATYTHSPFSLGAYDFNRFLGFEEAEETRESLHAMHGYLGQIRLNDLINKDKPLSYNRNALVQIVETSIKNNKGDPVELFLQEVPIISPHQACLPPLQLLLRQKYCLARYKRPIPPSIQAIYHNQGLSHNLNNKNRNSLFVSSDSDSGVIVAVECVADSCFKPSKITNSLEKSLKTISNLLAPKPLHVHFFGRFFISELIPTNQTFDLAPNLQNIILNPGSTINTHFKIKYIFAFHLMVTSDILLVTTGGSGLLMTVLHGGMVLREGTAVCKFTRKRYVNGNFDETKFKENLFSLVEMRPNFKSHTQCENLREQTYDYDEDDLSFLVPDS